MLYPSRSGQSSKMLIKITNLSDEVAHIGGRSLYISRISVTKLTPFILLHSYRVTTEQKNLYQTPLLSFPSRVLPPPKETFLTFYEVQQELVFLIDLMWKSYKCY